MKIIIAIVIVTIIGVVAFGIAGKFIDSTSIVASTSQVVDAGVSFTITGEVTRPGTYVLNEGARLIDLINAASGTTSNADPLSFNTDYVLKDSKDGYYIAPIYDNSNTCAVTPIAKCNINTADAETLRSIAGFGKSAAESLIDYRASVKFSAIEEIKDVPGIGNATYMSVRNKITLRDAGV